MAIHKIQPGDSQNDAAISPDRDGTANAPDDSLVILESWAKLLEHPENWPEVCLKWADHIDDDEAMARLRPILNNLFGYAAAKDGDSVEIFREKMRRAIDHSGHYTMLVDRSGRVMAIGEDAAQILGFAAGEIIKEQLLEPLPHLFEGAEHSATESLTEVFGRDGVRRLINVSRIESDGVDEPTLRISICHVFLPSAAESYLRKKLSLTDAEIEILSLSIQRHNIEGIAQKRNSSVNTIRTHIKNITSKLGCKNFNDVIVRTLEIIAYHQKDRPTTLDEIGGFFPTPQRAQILKLERNKGHVEYTIYGDPNMQPLVTLHSLEYGYRPSDEFISLARQSGFCIYSARRPGFGSSSPGDSISEDAARLDEFLALLNLENVVVVSFSTASCVALELTRSSKRLAQTIIVNYAFNAPSKLKNVKPKWLKGLLDLCLASQASFGFAFMLTGNLIKISGPSGFYEKLYETCSEDLQYLREHAAEFKKAANHLLSADRDTVRREIVGSFLFNPEVNEMLANPHNIVSVIGEHTHGVPLENARSEAAKHNSPFFVMENAGRNCVFQRPEEFFEIINSLHQAKTAQIN